MIDFSILVSLYLQMPVCQNVVFIIMIKRVSWLKLGKLVLKSWWSRQASSCASELKSILAKKIVLEQKKVNLFKKKYGKSKVSQITVTTIFGGLRECVCLWCDTSHLDPIEGIRFRGYSIPEVQKLLPKAEGGGQPLPEGLFWLLLTGDVPSKAQVDLVSNCWAENSELPDYVETMLDNLPHGKVHPMTQLSCSINLLNSESIFEKAISSGYKKTSFWEYQFDDIMLLIPKLIVIASKIYKNTFGKGKEVTAKVEQGKDWSHNFSSLLGFDDPVFIEFMRLFMTLHADHEGGNVSSHATHLIGSTLADPYLSLAGGLNGLAGPLHGLANQECLAFLLQITRKIGLTPTDERLQEYIREHLGSGKVIPGFGHPVLRRIDPRFTCIQEFCDEFLPDSPITILLRQVITIVVPELQATGKVKNPYPNMDCNSGVLLYQLGLPESNFYTVLFGVSRSLGALANLVWHRAIGIPMERPNSIPTDALKRRVKAK